MNGSWPSQFFGALFAPRWQGGKQLDLSAHARPSETGRPGWTKYLFRTERALLSDDVPSSDSKFHYPLMYRQGREGFLLAGPSTQVVEAILERLGVRNSMSNPSIDVAGLVVQLSSPGAQFSLGAVFARVDGFGQALKTVILYGQDLAQANLFRGLLPKIQPYRVGVKDAVLKEELLTIGSRGEVQFGFRTARDLDNVDRVLFFLTAMKFMGWYAGAEREGP